TRTSSARVGGQSMNVLVLTTTFPPEVRSAALLMWELAESLVGRGHRVTVITAPPEGSHGRRIGPLQLPYVEERSGVRVIRIPTIAPSPPPCSAACDRFSMRSPTSSPPCG